MYILNHNKRPIIENSQIVSVANLVRESALKNPSLNLSLETDAQSLIKHIEENITLNLKQEINGKFEFSSLNKIKLTYVKSNLGKGFIFLFICNICGRRARYLYFPSFSEILACRQCHKLSYKRQNKSKNDRIFDKLL